MVRGIKTAFCTRVLGALLFAVALVIAGCGQITGREEFSKMVMEKSEQEVTTNVGKPAKVDASNPQRVVWTYNKATYNVEKGNATDNTTMVIFAPNPATGKLKAIAVEYGN